MLTALILIFMISCGADSDLYDELLYNQENLDNQSENIDSQENTDEESSEEENATEEESQEEEDTTMDEESSSDSETNTEGETTSEEDTSSETTDVDYLDYEVFTITSVSDLSSSANANKLGLLTSNLNLNGQNVNLANGLIIKPDGGLLSNGAVTGNNSSIHQEVLREVFSPDIKIYGTWFGDVNLIWFSPPLNEQDTSNYAFENAINMLSNNSTLTVNNDVDYMVDGFISTFRSPSVNNITYNFKGRLVSKSGADAAYGTLRVQQQNAVFNNLNIDGNRTNITNPYAGFGTTSNLDLASSKNITFNNLTLTNTITVACTANIVENIRINGFDAENIGEHVFYLAFGVKGFYLYDFTINKFGDSSFNVNHECNILKTVGYFGDQSQAEFVNGYIELPPGIGTDSPKTFFSNTVPNTLIENVNMSSNSDNFYVMYASDDSSIVRIKNSDFNDDPLFYNITNQIPANSGTYSANGANANNTFLLENSKFGGWYLNLINEAVNCTFTVNWSLQKSFQNSTTVPNTKQVFNDCTFIFNNEIDYKSLNGDVIFNNCEFIANSGTYAAFTISDPDSNGSKILFNSIKVDMPNTFFVNATGPTDVSIEFKDSNLTSYKSFAPVNNIGYFASVNYNNTTGKGSPLND